MDVKRFRDLSQHGDRRVILPPLNPSKISHIHIRFMCELLLAEPSILANLPNVEAYDLFPKHSAN